MNFNRSLLSTLVVTTLVLHIAEGQDVYNDFLKFIEKYGKTYLVGTTEFKEKFINFQKNHKLQYYLNKTEKYPSAVYGVTKFSDLSLKEFKDIYLSDLMHKRPKSWSNSSITSITPLSRIRQLKDIPLKLDWREHNIISGIKNQLKCGGCWAFSTVETVESIYANKTGQSPLDLSVQQVIDCDGTDFGCAGGDICSALRWMIFNKIPIVTETEYPLTDESNMCKVEPQGAKGVLVKSHQCYSGSSRLVGQEHQLLQMIYEKGPVAVAVDAQTWYNYQGGIIQHHCENHNNHAVQIVGYDISGKVPYYIVRNSWGTDFGDNGYLYIKVGDNLCGDGQGDKFRYQDDTRWVLLLGPLEELSVLGNMLFRSMSV